MRNAMRSPRRSLDNTEKFRERFLFLEWEIT